MWRPPVYGISGCESALEKNKAEEGNGGGWLTSKEKRWRQSVLKGLIRKGPAEKEVR